MAGVRHGINLAVAQQAQQLLETRTQRTRARAPEIFVDHLDVFPSQLVSAFFEKTQISCALQHDDYRSGITSPMRRAM
jgi:hypothetical protein